MNIVKQTGTHGLTPRNRKPEYIALHYTAGITSKAGSARNTARWFNNPKAGGTADFICDDAEIVQYNPDPTKYYCWAVGGGKYRTKGGSLYGRAKNQNVVSIEICSNNRTGKVTSAGDGNWYFTAEAFNRAVELTKHLMTLYGIPASKVIRHYDVNGKICPGVPYWTEDFGPSTEWQRFKAQISGQTTTTPAQATTAPHSGSFQWQVTIPDLNIRSGPGRQNPSRGFTGKGVFTITETSGNWGHLKSGAGWISLDPEYGHRVGAASVPASAPTTKPAPQKSVDDVAREVIAGKWGTGTVRTQKLSAAGYDPAAVQNRVNALLGASSKPQAKSLDEIAREVIAGKWGTGAQRKARLTAAGYDANAVQKRVNALL